MLETEQNDQRFNKVAQLEFAFSINKKVETG